MNNNDIPKTTPWGDPDDIKILAPGIVKFSTPGHGGIWLSPERNAQVPMRLKKKTFMQNGLRGWYEEDCDQEIVYRVFDSILTFRESNQSRGSLEQVHAIMRSHAAAGPMPIELLAEAFGISVEKLADVFGIKSMD